MSILSTRNGSVGEIKDIILSNLPGESVNYISFDNVMDQKDVVHYPENFFNYLNPSDLPPHSLKLKTIKTGISNYFAKKP